jgi:hypothetical protein
MLLHLSLLWKRVPCAASHQRHLVFAQTENQQLNQQLQIVSDELEKNKIKYQEALDSWQQNKQRLQVLCIVCMDAFVHMTFNISGSIPYTASRQRQ